MHIEDHVGAELVVGASAQAVAGRPARRSAATGRFYHPELDGLRFLAFLAVFVHHAVPRQVGSYVRIGVPEWLARWAVAAADAGGTGVDFFFCLSSFLITELLIRETERFGSVDLKSFWVRRCLRIWPLYYAFVILVGLVAPAVLGLPVLSSRQAGSFLLFFANWECAWFGYPASVVAPLWSVAIEEQFYLVWPLIVKVLTPRRVWVAVASMLGVAVIARAFLVQEEVPHPGIWCNTFARLDPIALGAAVALVRRRSSTRLTDPARWALAGLGFAAIVTAFRVVAFDDVRPAGALVVAYLVVAMGCAAILVAALRPVGGATTLLAHPWAVYLGRISYGLYVMHSLGLAVGSWLASGVSGVAAISVRTLVGFGLTLALAAASYQWLEKPFLRIKSRFAMVESRPE